MASDFFKFHFKDWQDDVKPLSLAARGLLIELIIHLKKSNGEMIVDLILISRLSGGLTEQLTECLTEYRKFEIFDFKKTSDGQEILISRKIKKELKRSETNSRNGKNGGNPVLKKQSRLTEKISDPLTETVTFVSDSLFKEKTKRFQKPAIEELAAYFLERKWGLDFTYDEKEQAESFLDYYTSKGWKVGNVAMKDWKAAARNWIKNIGKYKINNNQNGNTKNNRPDYESEIARTRENLANVLLRSTHKPGN